MSLFLRHIENSHVKQNLVHTLYQVRRYGQMPMEKFHGIILLDEMDRALKYKPVSWYLLPSDVLTSLIYRMSTLILIICNGTLCILLSLEFLNFKLYIKFYWLCFIGA
jgi:hypothetical protein